MATTDRPQALDDLLNHLAATAPPLPLDDIDMIEDYIIRMSRRHGIVNDDELAAWQHARDVFVGLGRLVHGWGDVEVARWRETLTVPVTPARPTPPRSDS
jgi:hypothetical protein